MEKSGKQNSIFSYISAELTFSKIRTQKPLFKLKAELFHTDRQTDITKLTVSFRNVANTPKKVLIRIR
jgi:hypothetical protein